MDARGLASDEYNSSEDEASPETPASIQQRERTPLERNAFLFRSSLSPLTHDLSDYHPLPSQIPFLIDVYAENVNFVVQIVHLPNVKKMVRDLRGSDTMRLSPSDETLMFAMYFAAVTSMEEDEVSLLWSSVLICTSIHSTDTPYAQVTSNFGVSKADLSLKYRIGLESALAKADFLNAPDLTLVQAFAIFMCLVRRHDSPRFVWMMTGLLIRMAQYLGLQRDGVHFAHLTTYEIEIRRRVWWVVCALDVRASEDQGTDLTIASGSFDTKMPLNINDADLSPETKDMAAERGGVTDMSSALISFGLTDIARRMMGPGIRDGAAGLEDQSRFLDEMYRKYEHGYFHDTDQSSNIAYWVGATCARLTMAKMTLIVFLPVLFTSPSEHFSDTIRTKLLISAIEVAEYNHALNAEPACRQWRWLYQTYTHWHATVYLMIEISRRPWSAIVERAWAALHSSWLIPAQRPMDKNLRIWVPLRKLMAKARKHREAELSRLRADRQAAIRLDAEDRQILMPSSSALLPTGSGVTSFQEWWCRLVALPGGRANSTQTSESLGAEPTKGSMNHPNLRQATMNATPTHKPSETASNMTHDLPNLGTNGQQDSQALPQSNIGDQDPSTATNIPIAASLEQNEASIYDSSQTAPMADWSNNMGPGLVPWMWPEADTSLDAFSGIDVDSFDVNMDLDGEMDWYTWVESAAGDLGWQVPPASNGRM